MATVQVRVEGEIMLVEVPRDRIGEVIAIICEEATVRVNVPVIDAPRHYARVGGKKVRTCSKCGKPGHRKDSCPGGSKEKDDADQLTRSQYHAVRESVKNGATSKDAANDAQIPVREANLACQFNTYEKYVDGR